MDPAQQDNTLLILSVCGIAAVVAAVLILAALLLLRVMRWSIFGIVQGFIQPLLSPPSEQVSPPAEAYISRSPLDLKAKAQQLDFDEAVAKYRADENLEPGFKPAIEPAAPTSIDAQLANASPSPLTPASPTPLSPTTPAPFDAPIPPENTQNTTPLAPGPSPLAQRRAKRDRSEDEIFGGFMDINGDGDEDF
jgi:hypothetical protein